jgi:ubiquinone/menaquinone biosynthesis C-methylase UbiE
MSTFESEWRARFERFARRYDDEALISGWSAAGLQRRLALFQELLDVVGPASPATVLDLGCGAGTYVRLLAGLGHRALGLDYSLPTLARAMAGDPGGKGRYLAGEAYALPFRSESVDLVVSIGVLQALGDPERALDEMVRVLRPGGGLAIEALNSLALTTRAQRVLATIRRLPPRVLTHDPRRVQEWLAGRGLEPVRRMGLCLPPRQLPGLGPLLERGRVRRALDASPVLAATMAHAFWFVCRKPASRPGEPA